MRFPTLRRLPAHVAGLVLVMMTVWMAGGQVIYEESEVPKYELPEALKLLDGGAVKTAAEWESRRRPEVVRLFESEMYGRSPGQPSRIAFEVKSSDPAALGGKAARREVEIVVGEGGRELVMRVLMYRPNGKGAVVPAFLGMNFKGNHTIHADPGITIGVQEGKEGVIRPGEETRGSVSGRWPVEKIMDRGYALVTLYYGDVDPDFHDGFKNGIHAVFPGREVEADGWGSIAGWAWGLSRVMDYLEWDDSIGPVALLGHSRLGKTSLWAGALDERFAIVISNDSGCGGAALSRRRFGESVKRINSSFPHWFCGNFKKYDDNEGALPVDQHLLVALMAPRPVYVASAVEDRWADPRGEFLAARFAGEVYALYGMKGVGVEEMPGVNLPVGDRVGYHIRTGKHDVTEYDWDQYLSFADRHLGRR